MHDISYNHQHELDEDDFSECCKDCLSSVDIIKPHIMAFATRIKGYTREMLAALSPGDLYRLYQVLDDLAHMGAGVHLLARWKELQGSSGLFFTSTPTAVTLSFATTMIWFGGLLFAHHRGLASLGAVMVLGSLMGMVASLFWV
ncbi:MAG: hypothetical protein U9N58_01025 [Thermodesulfobacteriota bacterium]|nr:hypothetical protein [Thermodesulfobacteriota bacterium]